MSAASAQHYERRNVQALSADWKPDGKWWMTSFPLNICSNTRPKQYMSRDLVYKRGESTISFESLTILSKNNSHGNWNRKYQASGIVASLSMSIFGPTGFDRCRSSKRVWYPTFPIFTCLDGVLVGDAGSRVARPMDRVVRPDKQRAGQNKPPGKKELSNQYLCGRDRLYGLHAKPKGIAWDNPIRPIEHERATQSTNS
jgi:hypothetical protein